MFILDTDHLGILQGPKGEECCNVLKRIAEVSDSNVYTTCCTTGFQARRSQVLCFDGFGKPSYGKNLSAARLTRNIVDYERIPGLIVQDWTSPVS